MRYAVSYSSLLTIKGFAPNGVVRAALLNANLRIQDFGGPSGVFTLSPKFAQNRDFSLKIA